MMWRILLYALIGYVTVLAVVFLLQRKMLYLPSDYRPSGNELGRDGLSYWPSPDQYRGFVGQSRSGEGKGTIIVFHGNAGTAYHRNFYVNALSQYGIRVLLAEYPGYGGRVGQPSEDVLVKDAITTIELAYRQYGQPLFLWGESLGCGVVAGAVSKIQVPIQGVVLFLPWDTLPDLAQTHYWYFPARWLVHDAYNNIENLRQFEGRIAVVLAEKDEVVPVQHGMRLYESINTDKKLWVFKQTTHNEVPVHAGLPWWQEVVAYITK
ncbi:serine aminopeptidase domain-containing protein [Desulfogranum marinum]|uniref:alpha/beta hydrolase n=1 Tax=Desulfogranum marinum TaxID=453220 RepID=UPI0029C75B56|nr:alpha/beta hydrolase [Desulfogranum marinum]